MKFFPRLSTIVLLQFSTHCDNRLSQRLLEDTTVTNFSQCSSGMTFVKGIWMLDWTIEARHGVRKDLWNTSKYNYSLFQKKQISILFTISGPIYVKKQLVPDEFLKHLMHKSMTERKHQSPRS